jgi:hypothetical protein
MPGKAHEARVGMLDSLARLAGFTDPVYSGVGGKRPDVLWMDPNGGRFFFGEAKDTETPGNQDTRRRLRNYLSYFGLSISVGLQGSIFAVCVADNNQADAWGRVLDEVTSSIGLRVVQIERWPVPDAELVLWLKLEAANWPSSAGSASGSSLLSKSTVRSNVTGRTSRRLG